MAYIPIAKRKTTDTQVKPIAVGSYIPVDQRQNTITGPIQTKIPSEPLKIPPLGKRSAITTSTETPEIGMSKYTPVADRTDIGMSKLEKPKIPAFDPTKSSIKLPQFGIPEIETGIKTSPVAGELLEQSRLIPGQVKEKISDPAKKLLGEVRRFPELAIKETSKIPVVRDTIIGIQQRLSGSGVLAGVESASSGGARTFEEAYNAIKEERAGDPSKLNQFLYQLTDTVPQTALGVALNFVPVAGKPLSATYWATLSSADQLEKYGEIKSVGNIVIDVVGDRMLGSSLEAMFKAPANTLKQTIIQGFVSEGGTEVAQDLLKYGNDYKNAKTLEEKQAVLDEAKKYFTSGQILMTAGVGGLSGAGIATGGYVINKANELEKSMTPEQKQAGFIKVPGINPQIPALPKIKTSSAPDEEKELPPLPKIGPVASKPPVETPKVLEATTIPTELQPLAEEAKKYKSAEEFVEAQTPRVGGIAPELQGQTLYRGMSEGEWQAIQSGGVSGKASKGGRTFLTTEKQTADMAVEAGKGNGVVVELKPEAGQKVISGGKIGENTGGNLPGEYQARDIGIDDIAKVTDGNGKVIYEATTGGKTKSQLTDIYNKAKGEEKPSFKLAEPYKESGDLTTKLLTKLEGKTTVSKQFISDLTNSGDMKQVEKDMIRQALETEGDKVDVAKFAEKVKAELLPLKTKSSDTYKPSESSKYDGDNMVEEGNFTPKYEGIALPKDVRGDVANYRENLYESPIPTSAGSVHFQYTAPNYFGHTRVEDMADDTTRRVIEVQSDLYQKGNLEKEYNKNKSEVDLYDNQFDPEGINKPIPEVIKNDKRAKEVAKLQQYNDPTAHFRMVREEVKKAAQDGKTKLQFPTGETAMKIEGLGETSNWRISKPNAPLGNVRYPKLTIEDLKVGTEIHGGANIPMAENEWVITDVLGDGKFKAVQKTQWEKYNYKVDFKTAYDRLYGYRPDTIETFDISGKVDTNNPIYKFYEKDLGKYLANNFGAKTVVDSKGVNWYEVDIKPEMADKAVTAFNRPIFTQDPQILRQEALDMIAKEIPNAKVFFYEPGELGLGVEGQHTVSEFFGDIIKLVERDGKVGLITAKHEVKHALFSKLDSAAQKEAIAIAKREIGPMYKTILEKRYGEKGKYVGVNRENALLEEYIVDKWAKADANAEGKYTKSVFGKIFEALDKLLKKIVDTYNEIKPKWDKFFKDRGGSQGGYVDFFGEKGKGISETERLVAQGKVRIKEKDGKKIFQYNNKGDWFTAINEQHAVDQFKKEKITLPPKKEVKADIEDSQINKLTEKIIKDDNVISDEEFDYIKTMRDEIKQYKSESVLGDLADRIVNGGLKIRTGKSYKTEARELLGGHYMRLFTTNPEAESLDEIVQTAINQGEDVTVDDLIDTINDKIAIRKAQIELNKQAKEKSRLAKEKLQQRIEERKQSLKSAYQKTYMQALKENKITEAKTLEQESDILDQIYKKQDVEIPIDSLRGIIDKIQTPVNKKVGLHDYFRTPEKVLNKIGLGKEAVELRESYENYQSELPEHIQLFKNWKKEVDSQARYKLDKFQTYLPPEVKIFKYLDGNLDELKTPLSPTEYKVAIEIKEYLSDWAYRLGLPEDDQIKHYITHLFENELVEQEFDEDLAKIIRDKIPGEVYDPFLQERIGAKGFKQDVWASLDAYAKRGVRKVNMDPILAKIKEASSRMEDSQQQYIKKHIDTINMRPTDVETLIDNTLKQIFGYKFGQRPFTTLSRSGRQMIYRAMLGGNIGSALKNLTQGVNTYAELGEKYTLKGYSKLLTNMGSGGELEKVGVLKNDMIQDRVDSVRESLLQKGDKVLFYLFETAEKINRGAAYFGAKQKALDEGKSEYEAVEYAKSIVRKTQFNFGSIDTPVALGSDLMKTMLQFSTFPIKQMEFLSGKMKAKDWAGLLRYIGATIAIVLGVGKLFNIKWKDFNPFTKFANLFDAPPLLNVPTEIVKAVMDEPGYFGQKRDAGEKISDVFQTGVSNIVPGGVQIMKSYRGLKKGNQPIKGFLLGPSNIEKKKKSKGVLPTLPSLPKLPKLPKI